MMGYLAVPVEISHGRGRGRASSEWQILFGGTSGGEFGGGQGRNRTADTGIFSPVLYRLSYLPKSFVAETGQVGELLRHYDME